MNLDPTTLRLFTEIARTGSLTQGAQAAFRSPAAASARIRALEEALGQQLLYRDNKGVTLTEAGQTLLRHAHILLRQIDTLRDEITQSGSGHIRIYANTTAVTEFMPEILSQFLATRPLVTVDLQERLTHDILRGVEDGSADLGIVSGPVERAGMVARTFSTDRLMLATPIGHPLARRDAVDFAATLDHDHIGLHEGSTLLAFLRGLMGPADYARRLRVQVRSFEAMCRMVEAGVGLGIVPESAARRHARTMEIALVALTDDWATRDRKLLIRDTKALPRAAADLADAIMSAGAGGTLTD